MKFVLCVNFAKVIFFAFFEIEKKINGFLHKLFLFVKT